jgi:hypothetical protein
VNRWNAAAVIVSSVSALISLAALLWNLRWSRLTTSINLVLDLDDRFNNKLKSCRKEASAKLLQGDPEPDKLDAILDFLDILGYLTRMKVVDKDFVWETFQYWIVGYYLNAKNYIDDERGLDATHWEHLVALYEVVQERERKHRPGKDIDWSAADLKDFLEGEASLS